jgi:hypothetical protein
VHVATRVLRSRVVRLSWSSRFFMQAAASKMPASYSSVYPPLFCKLRASYNPTNKNLTELCLEIQTPLNSVTIQNKTHAHMKFFLTNTDTITSQNIYLSSWITLYKYKYNKNVLCTGPHNMCYNKQISTVRNRTIWKHWVICTGIFCIPSFTQYACVTWH